MKRVVVSESNKYYFAIDIMLYIIISFIGYCTLGISLIQNTNIIDNVVSLFFLVGFFSLVSYFLNRKINDYEFLFLGLSSICVSGYILFAKNFLDLNYLLSCSMIFYLVLYLFNKIINIHNLFKQKNLNFIPKCSVTILVIFLTLFATVMLFTKGEVAILIYGYYFIAFGLLNLIEILLIILFNGKTFRYKLIDLLSYDKDEDKKTVKSNGSNKLRKVNSKRIASKTKVLNDNEEIITQKKSKKNKKVNK